MPKDKKNAKGGRGEGGKKGKGSDKPTSKVIAPVLKLNEIPDPNGRCFILNSPPEIKQKIWTFAITQDHPIVPLQVKSGSNKFTSSQKQWVNGLVDLSAEPKLNIVTLSKVCKTIYNEVALTHLFYAVNRFEFFKPMDVIKYLVALTPNRRSAIRSLILHLEVFCFSYVSPLIQSTWATIASCTNLETLHIKLSIEYRLHWNINDFKKGIHGKEFGQAIRGLKTFTVNNPTHFSKRDNPYIHMANEYESRVKAGNIILKEIEAISEEQSTKERFPQDPTSKLFLNAIDIAGLYIDGNGRLGEDRKPGMVSSRTRQGIKDLKKLDADGTIPIELCPKYGPQGELNWVVDEIRASRVASDDMDIGGVEFEAHILKSQSSPRNSSFQTHCVIPPEIVGYSWETAMALNFYVDFRREILFFYKREPEAFGKEEILELWKAYPSDDPTSAALTKDLKAIIVRQATIERIKKGREERQAVKEAKMARKAKKSAKAAAKLLKKHEA